MKNETPNLPHTCVANTEEGLRLADPETSVDWRRWGPYLSERQWGTVREDYSPGGTAWDYFPHDHARSRAYRWGEDGIGGFADDHLYMCLNVAMWNGQDPILKERLFGLTNSEGNHGEDVKEVYYYLDGTPTHSYMRMLYKYPQRAFPYSDLVATNRARGLNDREYELIDTGVFDDGRYFDVDIEYAKAAPDDILLCVTVQNRGPEVARLHLLPQLWARNTWAWAPGNPRPRLEADGVAEVRISHPALPPFRLVCDGAPQLLFCDNDTNVKRLYGADAPGFFKDGINDFIVHGAATAVNPDRRGTKMAAHYLLDIPAGGTATVRLRLRPEELSPPRADFEAVIKARRAETAAFYAALQEGIEDADSRLVQRQALAGMLWSKQYYGYDVRHWLQGDPLQPPPPPERRHGRNATWQHLVLSDIISMPDAWEYPWFAAWDLAFHCVTFALIDPAFAKAQLVLLTQANALAPSGQMPAYEWQFGDVNPPVQAWAALQIYEIDRQRCGAGDTAFLERVFHKLILNFTWWVNREDSEGRNIFQGGFLGLDNISLFDRSVALPNGGHIDQSDGTAWMAMYAINLMRMALELAMTDHIYEDLATKFFEHFLYVAEAVHAMGGETGTGLWDDTDGFYYDVLEVPGRPPLPLRVRSLVGLIPLLAVEVLHDSFIVSLPDFTARLQWFLDHRPDLAELVSHYADPNRLEYRLLSLMRRDRMNRVLFRMLDETEFLSDFGVRSVSKYHEAHPCTLFEDGHELTVRYTPGESTTSLFGGNSNWRGPIWMPVNFLLVEALYKYHKFYGDDHRVEYPSRSGTFMSLKDVADELTRRLRRIFLNDASGRRAMFGDSRLLQDDAAFRDNLFFHEYFHGDTGRGLGASHQTGWTGLIALLLHPRAELDPAHVSPATETVHPQTESAGGT